MASGKRHDLVEPPHGLASISRRDMPCEMRAPRGGRKSVADDGGREIEDGRRDDGGLLRGDEDPRTKVALEADDIADRLGEAGGVIVDEVFVSFVKYWEPLVRTKMNISSLKHTDELSAHRLPLDEGAEDNVKEDACGNAYRPV